MEENKIDLETETMIRYFDLNEDDGMREEVTRHFCESGNIIIVPSDELAVFVRGKPLAKKNLILEDFAQVNTLYDKLFDVKSMQENVASISNYSPIYCMLKEAFPGNFDDPEINFEFFPLVYNFYAYCRKVLTNGASVSRSFLVKCMTAVGTAFSYTHKDSPQ